MECAASLNELQQVQHGVFAPILSREQYDTAAATHADAFLKSSYALPLKIFARAAPEHAGDRRISLISLNLIIYFALNPPLPPRVLSMPARSYRWFEIYPPHRFILALHALKNVRPLADPESAVAMYQFLAALAEASSLPYAADTPMPRRSTSEADDWDVYSEAKDHPRVIDDELVIQAQLHIEKIPNRLPMLANYSSCITGPIHSEFVERLVNFDERFDFMSPPLEWLEDGKIGFNGSRAFGNNILRSVAISHALFEMACGSGTMTLDQLPLEVCNNRSIIDLMHRSLYKMIVETDNL
jgi:hypothetical protein